MKRLFLIYSVVVASIIVMQSCETWRQECEGEIKVQNPIPDTTLYVGGEPFRKDVFEPPVVFRQTEEKPMTFVATSSDGGTVVSANGRRNDDGKVTILEVVAKRKGDTQVSIRVSDGCGELEHTFNVTILDTTQQKN